MTSKQIYEATAIELSRVQAPALKLYEFNYLFNQAIRQFVNKVYNVYDINQQTTDDLRVLKSTATLVPTKMTSSNKVVQYAQGATYYVDMPDDYLHLLNCICLYEVKKQKDCWNEGDVMVVGATKMTADSWSSIVDDVYNRPTKKRPYYYIHNQNQIHTDGSGNLTEANGQLPSNLDTDSLKGFRRTFDYYEPQKTRIYNEPEGTEKEPDTSNSTEYNVIEKPAGSRHANTSKVRIEIRCGKDTSDSVFKLEAVQIDYVKAPQLIRLTQEQLDSDEDISQVMEFPDYVNQEIINELVNLIMRKTNDPSLQAHMQITQSIARPTGQQQQTAPQA